VIPLGRLPHLRVVPHFATLEPSKSGESASITRCASRGKGKHRRKNQPYFNLLARAALRRKAGKRAEAARWKKLAQTLPSYDPNDPDYRRLRYCRYADDILLGFSGPRSEAEEIKQRLGEFLRGSLHLELSQAKTLLTHARTEKARFLGYHIHTRAR
jgi:hypothetical protein